MRLKKSYSKDYTKINGYYQLSIPFNLEILIPEDDSVRLLSHILEGLNYEKLYRAYSSKGRKSAVLPRIMYKVLTYAYMNGIYSSRKIESACKRDINFMWLLEGENAPDHATIARFRKTFLQEAVEDLFYQLVQYLHSQGEINFENLFVDGTKIESCANKYSFVWKKAVNKNEAKMFDKITSSLSLLNTAYSTEFMVSKDSIASDLATILDFLEEIRVKNNIEFCSGIGKKKTQLQRYTEEFSDYRLRQEKYDIHNGLFDGRNSYSKTDTDATFMHMKDDHMRNAQLKPGYNVQIGVESEYITGVGIYSDRSDVNTLIPFLESLAKNTGSTYTNIIADSGYESEENYLYLEEKKQKYYIKPQSYELWKRKSFKNDISKRENMAYDEEKDEYTCKNAKKLRYIGKTYKKSRSGYVSEVSLYECEDCTNCNLKEKCTKALGNKRLQVSKKYIEKRQISFKNISSEKGILLRINRSIQVEGAFGVLKSDYGFNRFLTRGKQNVKTEFLLLCFGFNVNKLHNKIQNERIGQDLHIIKTA